MIKCLNRIGRSMCCCLITAWLILGVVAHHASHAEPLGAHTINTQNTKPALRPISEFRLGNAVAPIYYYMTAWTVNDLFKMAGYEGEIGDKRPSRAWIPVVDGQWLKEKRWDVPTDPLGWPTSLSLPDGQTAQRLTCIVVANDLTDVFPPGTYTLRYTGTGRLEFDGVSNVTETRPGEITFNYDGSSEVFVSIVQTDPKRTGDYLRDIRILRPDAVEGEAFNRTYIEDIRPYDVIRPMHMLGEQLTYGPAIPWADRKPPNYSHWGGAWGTPYEVVIDLANASDSDLWLNVPVAASDEFMRQLAKLTAERLDPKRRLYIELGNELWNWAMPYEVGRQHGLAEARKRWPGVEGRVTDWSDGDPVNEMMMLYSWQGARTAEMGAIFRDAFKDQPDRLVVVLAGQIGASAPYWAPSRYLLESPVWVAVDGAKPAATHADAYAVGPYVGEPEGDDRFSRESPEAYIADAIRYLRGEGPWHADAEEPGLRYSIRHDRAMAAEFGLPLIAYEGGQHFIGSRFTRDQVNVHPDMTRLYHALFDVWREEGGGLFVHYAGTIPRGTNNPGEEPSYYQSENFGTKERQTQTEEDAPKYRALRQTMRDLGQLEPTR